MKRLIGIALAALAVAVVAAGCGDSKDSDTLSKTEFTTQANAICKKGSDEIDKAGQKIFKSQPTKQQLEQFSKDVALPNVKQQVDDVDALKPPDEIKDQVDAFIAQAMSDLAKIEADPSSLAQQGQDSPFAETDKLGKELGLDACASGS